MEQIEQLLQFYRTGFRCCMVLAIAGGVMTVCLFFRFDIRTIWRVRSRRARSRTIRRLEEENRQTEESRDVTAFDDNGELTTGTVLLTGGGDDFTITECTIALRPDREIRKTIETHGGAEET